MSRITPLPLRSRPASRWLEPLAIGAAALLAVGAFMAVNLAIAERHRGRVVTPAPAVQPLPDGTYPKGSGGRW